MLNAKTRLIEHTLPGPTSAGVEPDARSVPQDAVGHRGMRLLHNVLHWWAVLLNPWEWRNNRALTRSLEPELQYSLGVATSGLRWMTIVMLLSLALLQPRIGRVGLANWELLLLFALYNLITETIMFRVGGRTPLLWRTIIDLPATGLVYFCSTQPGAPQFDLVFLAVFCTAVNIRLLDSLMYTTAAVILTALIEPTLPLWRPDSDSIRELGSRMVTLALAGTGTAIMARLLTREHEHTRTARQETERLEQIDRQREDFIATISHDLRTPFTAVRAGLGMVQMSTGDRLRPEEQHLLNNVSRNADRLGILINDLLAFTQVEAGALRLDLRPLDLADIIEVAASSLQPLLREKGQSMEIHLERPLPHLGDGKRLEQVIVNLLDNAHRHTPPGTCITITGHLQKKEILVTIQDNGPGIPPQECVAIFQRFHRVDLAEGGWGLGLTIAQAITEKHGGRIWVDSELGLGATFHIGLPLYVEDDFDLEEV